MQLILLLSFVLLLAYFKHDKVVGKNTGNQIRFTCDDKLLATQARWLNSGRADENIIFWRDQRWSATDGTTLKKKCIDVSRAFQQAYQAGYLKHIISIEDSYGRGIICASLDRRKCNYPLYQLLPGNNRVDVAKQLFGRLFRDNTAPLTHGDFSFDIERFLSGGKITFNNRTLCSIQKAASFPPTASSSTVTEASIRNDLVGFTVRIDAMESQGSGVIVAREGNVYCVLTAKHNVQTSVQVNRYIRVVTPDGVPHVAQNPRLASNNTDLAILEFVSNKRPGYGIATIGQLEQSLLKSKETVYVAGFPASRLRPSNAPPFISEGKLDAYSRSSLEITYTPSNSEEMPTFGMSGGPILSSQGLLVGIHGAGEFVGPKTVFLGGVLIDVGILSKMASVLGLKLETAILPPPVPTSKPVSKPPAPTPSPLPSNIPQPSDPTTMLITTNRCPGCNMSGLGFRSVQLRRADLRKAKLHGTNFSFSDLSEADLSEADLLEADLGYARLNDTNLRGANLQKSRLTSAKLSGANLRGADLQNADLSFANLDGADLSGANFQKANLRYTSLRNTKRDGANFKDADIESAKW